MMMEKGTVANYKNQCLDEIRIDVNEEIILEN